MYKNEQVLWNCVNDHSSTAWSACEAVWDLIQSQDQKDRKKIFFTFIDRIYIEDVEVEDEDEFLPKNVADIITEDINRLVNRIIKNLVRRRPSEEIFYENLWNKINDDTLLPNKKAQVSFLIRLWIDPRIPYFQVGEGCTMEDDEFNRVQNDVWPMIRKACFILSIPFSQKTQRASILMDLANELKDDRERAVFWAGVMSHLKETARPSEKSDT